MDKITHIRDGEVVYERNGEEGHHFYLLKRYDTINKAKRFTRELPLGTVARKETIIRDHGEKFYNELIS